MADSFLTELKRRNVFKVSVAYLVLAWVVIQVTSEAVPALRLPDWVNSLVFFLGVIGFPFAIFFAWAFEITPEGIKKESEIAPEDSITAHTGRKLDFAIIALLAVGMGYFIYESRFESETVESVVVNDSTKDSTVLTETLTKTISEPEGSSIAVLPFVNMSSDKEQDYFSDGISEEILNVLAKIPNLHVTSRSSAFFYKGKDIKINKVAQELGVKNVLEGSVRKAGNRIRITAQLIEAGSDKHLWSETYDRELIDIFAIQDEISAAIVEALKSKLGLEAKVSNRDMSKVNLDAHNEYLKGRFYIENRNQEDLEKALAHFDKAVELAPNYAPAWMGKGWATYFLSEGQYGNIPNEVANRQARPALEKALQLEPTLAEAHGVMALIVDDNGNNKDESNAYLQEAIRLNPNYADAYSWYGNNLADYPSKYLEYRKKAVQLSPMSLLANLHYATSLLFIGEIDEARKIAQHMLTINDSHEFTSTVLAYISTIEGNHAEAAIVNAKIIENSTISRRFKSRILASLSTLGLNEQVPNLFEGTDFSALKYWYNGNLEYYISQIRAIFPRNETDELGYLYRALAETHAENYTEAVKYYELTNICMDCIERIYSYQRVGNDEIADQLLSNMQATHTAWTNTDVQYWEFFENIVPAEIMTMELAFLEGDTEKAIANLKLAMAKNYIIDYLYKTMPMFKKLRKHSDWPALLAESDRRAAIQRDIYLKWVAGKDTTTL